MFFVWTNSYGHCTVCMCVCVCCDAQLVACHWTKDQKLFLEEISGLYTLFIITQIEHSDTWSSDHINNMFNNFLNNNITLTIFLLFLLWNFYIYKSSANVLYVEL